MPTRWFAGNHHAYCRHAARAGPVGAGRNVFGEFISISTSCLFSDSPPYTDIVASVDKVTFSVPKGQVARYNGACYRPCMIHGKIRHGRDGMCISTAKNSFQGWAGCGDGAKAATLCLMSSHLNRFPLLKSRSKRNDGIKCGHRNVGSLQAMILSFMFHRADHF